jgi:hypothetical protein
LVYEGVVEAANLWERNVAFLGRSPPNSWVHLWDRVGVGMLLQEF